MTGWHVVESESNHMGMRRVEIWDNGLTIASLNMRNYPAALSNANKMVAAPEMLAALECVQAFLQCPRCHPDWPCIDHDGWEKGIDAAIAKARGEI